MNQQQNKETTWKLLRILVLRDFYVDAVERFVDEFVGTAKDLRGLFKIHMSTAVDSNLQQIICSTAKEICAHVITNPYLFIPSFLFYNLVFTTR